MTQNWLAYIYPAEQDPISSSINTTLPVRHQLNRMLLYATIDSHLHHWNTPHWTLVVISSSSVKETFLDEWQRNPMKSVRQLRNAWILIAIDHTQDRIWCGRDGLGFANAYWRTDGPEMWLSDSIATLNATSNTPPTLAEEHLSEYLSFRYNHAPRTLYKNRYALIAGHFTILKSGRTREEQWYKPNWYTLEQKIPSEREAKLEVDYLLRRSLEPHLFSQQKFGVLLSGGLDSSAILYHANQLGFQLDSFTVTLEGQGADESPFAGRIAHLYNSPNHLLRLKSQDFIDALLRNAEQLALPLPTPATAIQDRLCHFAGQWVDILFSGDGGDEVFGGRSMATIARNIRRSKAINRLPRVTQLGLRKISKRLPRTSLSTTHTQFGLTEGIGGSQVFDPNSRASLLQDPAFIRPNIRARILTTLYQEIDSDPINDILYVWQRGWLSEDSLFRFREVSPNVRFPMLNRELREYCAQLPGHYKVRAQGLDFHSKWLLRLTMKDRIPKRLLSRPKRTMMAPLDRWLQEDGKNFLAQQITEMTQQQNHLFIPNTLHTLYREHTSGEYNHGLRLWTLILFHLWSKQHL